MNRCLQTDAKKFKIFYMPIISHHLSKQTIKLSFLISRRVPCIQHQPHTFQTQCMYVWMTNNAVGSELWVVNMPFNTAWGQIHGGRVSDQSHAKDSICASLSLSLQAKTCPLGWVGVRLAFTHTPCYACWRYADRHSGASFRFGRYKNWPCHVVIFTSVISNFLGCL